MAALADRWQAHRMLLVGTFAACILAQGAMALPAACSFGTMLALTVVASAVWTPSSIIADASVMAASTHVSALHAVLCCAVSCCVVRTPSSMIADASVMAASTHLSALRRAALSAVLNAGAPLCAVARCWNLAPCQAPWVMLCTRWCLLTVAATACLLCAAPAGTASHQRPPVYSPCQSPMLSFADIAHPPNNQPVEGC